MAQAKFQIMLNQSILQNMFNTLLHVAIRAYPNTWVAYIIVATAFLAIKPAALVLLLLVGGTQNPNATIEISHMMRCGCIIMNIVGWNILLQLIILWCILEKRVVNHLQFQLTQEIEQLGEVVRIFIEHKILCSEVSINLRDRKEIRKDKNWPTVCEPHPLNARNGMMEIIVVINSMTVAEVPFKWLHVLEGCCSYFFSLRVLAWLLSLQLSREIRL